MLKKIYGAVIEIGATKTRIAWNFRNSTFFSRRERETLKNYREEIKYIVDFCRKESIKNIILGIASPYFIKIGKLLNPPNLPDYRKREPVKDLKKFGIHAILVNDLELNALGEASYGGGKTYETVAFVGIGTGAGASLIKHKKIINGTYNFEAGHHILSLNKKRSIPGKIPGSFEYFISGSALRYRARCNPAQLKDRDFAQLVPRLSQALVNVSVFWSPDIILLGGAVARRFQPFLPKLRKIVDKSIRVIPPPKIAMAKLKDNAALVGGFTMLTLALHHHKEKSSPGIHAE